MVLQPAKGVAQPWGGVVSKTGDVVSEHGTREPAASTSRLCLGCFEVMSGKEGRTWVESRTGGDFQREGCEV